MLVIQHYGDLTREEAEADAALEDGLGPAVRLAGRIASLRSHGKVTFADPADRSGRVQLFLRQNVMGPDAYDLLDLLHVGDWVGVGRLGPGGRAMATLGAVAALTGAGAAVMGAGKDGPGPPPAAPRASVSLARSRSKPRLIM